jgi:two-component system chemotaxis response regulator CheB
VKPGPITKVLLVEDSATVAAYVASVLGSEPGIQLLPVARSAQDGVKAALERRPDVVLMDIKLPDHDGVWAIEQIMAEKPCPIVVLSGYLSSRERNFTFEALRAGAVEVLAKPAGLSPTVREVFRKNLLGTVRLMASAVVVRRNRRAPQGLQPMQSGGGRRLFGEGDLQRVRQVLIGASTGGPEVLYRLLSSLAAPLPYPVLITQHTLKGFDESLAQWLSCTGHQVRVASEGDLPVPGRVLLAPADKHLRIAPEGVTLVPGRPGETIASVDIMLESAARVWGSRCLAVLLTGMGNDGAKGMRAVRDCGALTVAQAPDTCVVASMPESASARGAVCQMLRPEEIADLLQQVAQTMTQASGDGQIRKGS